MTPFYTLRMDDRYFLHSHIYQGLIRGTFSTAGGRHNGFHGSFWWPNFQIVKANLEITISFVINHSPEDPKRGRGSEVHRTNFARIVCYF